jgi:hypothetical protein
MSQMDPADLRVKYPEVPASVAFMWLTGTLEATAGFDGAAIKATPRRNL